MTLPDSVPDSNSSAPRSIEDLSEAQLARHIMDAMRRTLVHYGCWFRETDHQCGTGEAIAAEAEAGDLALEIVLKRLGGILGFELVNGIPSPLLNKSRDELLQLLEATSINWLACDGVWFQAVEKRQGMDTAKRCNDTSWSRFSPYEAFRIKKLLQLSELPGIDGLKRALAFRLYASINKQSIEDIDEKSFIFRMNECRVQVARKRRNLPDYPCKSAGTIEYPSFARAIDARIKTECIGCPPDAHPEGWWCAWKFTLEE